MNNNKKICVVTGTRADYGYLKLIIKKIEESEKLELILLVTGIHLMKKYGYTINEIKEDKIPITKVIQMYSENSVKEESLGIAVGEGVIEFTKVLIELKPDVLLVLGDRFEVMAAVLAASTLSIPIAHIHGGDNILRGQVDEQIRHSITKFAHLHFPATAKSFERIKLLGEEEWRIHLVGSPTIDMIKEKKLLKRAEIVKKYGFNTSEQIILCIQHPYTFEANQAGEQMNLTLMVLKDMKLNAIIIYPNNDPGSDLIIKEIEANKNVSSFRIFKNIKRIDFLSLLKNVDLLIGNSSGGLIESPIFKLPVVNIGNRNKGRESAENVINVPYNYTKIKEAIIKGLSDEFKKNCQTVKNPYGEGTTSEKIVKILENLKIDNKLLIKELTYNV